MNIKRTIGFLFAIVFVLGAFSPTYARSYEVDGLNFSFELPDTWQVATRALFDEKFISEQYNKEASEWVSYMQRNDYYLFAAVPSDSEGQHEIIINAKQSDEPIDYNESYMFELELTAKASFKSNPNGSITYKSYDVVEGRQTKFLVFDYIGIDSSNKNYYGRFYHTVMNGLSIEYDMTSYVELDSTYLSMFEKAVLESDFASVATNSNARLKRSLSYIALIVLAIAFVAAIVIFIVSKIKEKKNFERAAQEAIEAQQNAEPLSDSSSDDEASGDESADE